MQRPSRRDSMTSAGSRSASPWRELVSELKWIRSPSCYLATWICGRLGISTAIFWDIHVRNRTWSFRHARVVRPDRFSRADARVLRIRDGKPADAAVGRVCLSSDAKSQSGQCFATRRLKPGRAATVHPGIRTVRTERMGIDDRRLSTKSFPRAKDSHPSSKRPVMPGYWTEARIGSSEEFVGIPGRIESL
jgi:hypothetical protein